MWSDFDQSDCCANSWPHGLDLGWACAQTKLIMSMLALTLPVGLCGQTREGSLFHQIWSYGQLSCHQEGGAGQRLTLS